jgi:tRNA pseudouridine55 synthase
VIDGILLLDKPSGPTSHDVVNRIRRVAGQRRVGHAGTLDPGATGLLVMLIGRLTRLADAFSGEDKSYVTTIELGSATDTGDAQGAVVRTAPVPVLAEQEIRVAVGCLVGERRHVPPAYSAVKHGGRPLYEHARAGREMPQVEPRTVTVHGAELSGIDGHRLSVRFEVSKGTYIRVLAEELGAALGVPAHLAALRRTRSGSFSVDAAHALDELEEGTREDLVAALVDPMAGPVGLPRALASAAVEEEIAFGRAITVAAIEWLDAPAEQVLLLGASQGSRGSMLAWYEAAGGGILKPRAVFARGSAA